jgi:hypothetical protein
MLDGFKSRVLVRVQHRAAHLAEQLEPRPDRQASRIAESRQRQPVDVFHGEPRRAIGQRVGVVQPSDAGVVEPRERLLLRGEAIAARGRDPRVAQDLDRDQAVEVRALRAIHDPHPAFTEDFMQHVGTQRARNAAVRVGEQPARDIREILVQQ